jgi:hypothetical protein
VADGWFSPGTLFSSNNNTDNYITEKIVESGVKLQNIQTILVKFEK